MIKRLLLSLVLNGLALYGVLYLVPSITYTGGIAFFAVGAAVMAVLNGIVKPILKLLTLPLQIITMGLSLIVLNGVLFWLFDTIIEILVIRDVSLTVPTVKAYFLAGFLFGLINWVEHLLFHHRKK